MACEVVEVSGVDGKEEGIQDSPLWTVPESVNDHYPYPCCSVTPETKRVES